MERSHSLVRTLTPELVLDAYRQGVFPMAHGKTGPVEFYYYEPRAILPLDERFTVRRSLRREIHKHTFDIRFDTAFNEVITACSRHDELQDEGVWLSEGMIGIYSELHRRGIAHSVEAWTTTGDQPELVGGLYGLAFGGAFCGESMFSRVAFASQVALVALVDHLREKEFTLLDAQMKSQHLEQFGLFTTSQKEYLEVLRNAMLADCEW